MFTGAGFNTRRDYLSAGKDKGFDENRIESMCMSRRLDIGGIGQVVSAGVQAFAAVEQAKREAKTAASKEKKEIGY